MRSGRSRKRLTSVLEGAMAENVSSREIETWFRENGRLEDVDAYMRAVLLAQLSYASVR